MRKLNIRPRVFVTIVLLSFVVWYFLRYNDVYELIVEKEVALVNLPSDFTLSENVDMPEVQFKLRGKGVYLHLYNLFNGAVEIDFETKLQEKDNQPYLFEIVNERFNFPYNLSLTNLYTKEINLSSKVLVERTVPVSLNTEVIYAENYVVRDSIGFVPDSVSIRGTYDQLKEVDQIKLLEDQLLITSPETSIDYELNQFSNDFEIFNPKVNYKILADELVTNRISLAVKIPELSAPTTTLNLPDSVLVEYRVISRLSERITVDDFKVNVISLENMPSPINTKIDVVLLNKALYDYTIISEF